MWSWLSSTVKMGWESNSLVWRSLEIVCHDIGIGCIDIADLSRPFEGTETSWLLIIIDEGQLLRKPLCGIKVLASPLEINNVNTLFMSELFPPLFS